MINTPQQRISKRVAFSAAHHIPGAGKCANNHGHNWVANITVDLVSGTLDSHGFICDVRDVKEAAYKYDHDDLNNYFEYPSTENVAQAIADDVLLVCSANNPEGTYIVNVHLVETENNTASASATNFTWKEPQLAGSLEDQKKQALDAEAAYAYGAGNPTPQPTRTAKFIKRSG